MNRRPTPFLDCLAYAYAAHADEFAGDLSRVCFIFPNRRAGTFFTDRLRRALPPDSQGVAPQITSIADAVEEWSHRVIASRTELLLTLYDCYRTVMNNMGGAPATFDAFRAWGEVLLTDFSEVEMYMVHPDEIFSNVKSLKQIATDYLTEEQKDLVAEYFGRRPHTPPTANFWTHYNNPVPAADSPKQRFIQLWEILLPLYEAFCAALEARGLTFTGRAYRQALENLQQQGCALLDCERVVLAGFNALTSVELAIFDTLRRLRRPGTDMPFADFYWDNTGVPLADTRNTAGYFLRRHTKPGRFPSLYSTEMHRSLTDSLPDRIELIASPSAAMQAKIAGQVANELLGRQQRIRPEQIAIVLPDEGLLLPMLGSLPQRAKDVNITMGYPLKLTAAATFVRLLRTLWRHSRRTPDGRTALFSEDVLVLLGHPLVRLLLDTEAVEMLHARIRANRGFTVDAELLIPVSPQANSLFSPLEADASPRRVTDYLQMLLENMRYALERRNADPNLLIDSEVDSTTLRLYSEATERLVNAVDRHGITPDARTFMLMTERLLSGERVQLEGRPLRGLQVMGMLETRCLDFDYVIIASMNEGVYPRRLHQRSFIPNNLRAGYAMASISHRESIFAYYFYRMISRAKEVYMIYDSRTEGVKSGDVSRYALQLQHLYARDKVRLQSGQFTLKATEPQPVSITKTPEIITLIHKYFAPNSGRALSVSSLQTLMSCELKFYLTKLRSLREEDEPDDQMTAAQMGTVMHAVMEAIYASPDGSYPYTVTDSHLSRWEMTTDDDTTPLARLVRRMINRHFYELPPSDMERPLPEAVKPQARVFERMAAQVINYDRTLTPFSYNGSEEETTVVWKLSDSVAPNMKFLIDRRDTVNGKPRIVDYKTGNYNLKITKIADLFSPDQPAKELFQLLTYACLQAVKDPAVAPQEYALQIYPLGKIIGNANTPGAWIKNTKSTPTLNDKPLALTDDLIAEFRGEFTVMLERLLDPDRPFMANPGSKACAFCPFRDGLCGV